MTICCLFSTALASEARAKTTAKAKTDVTAALRIAGYPTPETPARERVADDYFAEAVLVGDSLSEPFGLYESMPPCTVLSVIGISARTALTNSLFEIDGQRCTLQTKLWQLQPRVLYLWMGSNGVDAKDEVRVLEDYGRLLDQLLPGLPHTLVYLMAIPPVKRMTQEKHPSYTNKRVLAFNHGLRDLAQRYHVYYLPVDTLLMNEKGLLDSAYSAGDGIHLREPAYMLLSDYL
ncbi:MAG: GDSL-type esterase/lipase family protein, partial [Clostridia bacterium]